MPMLDMKRNAEWEQIAPIARRPADGAMNAVNVGKRENDGGRASGINAGEHSRQYSQ